jgi:hypothetical protein
MTHAPVVLESHNDAIPVVLLANNDDIPPWFCWLIMRISLW